MEKRTRTPSGGEEEDVDADEGNLGRNCRGFVLVFSSGGNTNNCNYKLADQHSKGTVDQDCTTTKFFNGEE